MAFEDLREQLRDRAAEALAKIQETSAFNSARERYESQTPTVQRAIIIGALVLVGFIILSIPMSYMTSSSNALAQFEENRELIQGLLRASRSAKTPPPLPAPQSADALRANVERTIQESGLLPDQIGQFETLPDAVLQDITPAGVVSAGVLARLKKLNLSQVIELGNFLQNMSPGLKLISVDVFQTAGTTHYYDMNAQIANFGIPIFSDNEPGPPDAKDTRPKKDELEGE